MDVVVVAIVGEANDEDGFELGRPPGSDLQAIEATPRNAHHPDIAVAPRLFGDPGYGGHRVVVLLNRVFVIEHTVRVAATTQIDPQYGVPMAREVWLTHRIAPGRSVALPVRQELK